MLTAETLKRLSLFGAFKNMGCKVLSAVSYGKKCLVIAPKSSNDTKKFGAPQIVMI